MDAEERVEAEGDIPRSTSATSSLDPYYFTNVSRNDSPVHTTEEGDSVRDSILRDRNGLVGLGELQTPRWSKTANFLKDIHDEAADDDDDDILRRHTNRPASDNDRDSPWTIEAVDGEPEEAVDVSTYTFTYTVYLILLLF